MDELQKLFDETLAKALAGAPTKIDESDIPEVAAQILEQMLPQLTAFMLKSFKRAAPKALRREQKDDAGFRRRDYRRWRKAFELLEFMWTISEEVGAKFNECGIAKTEQALARTPIVLCLLLTGCSLSHVDETGQTIALLAQVPVESVTLEGNYPRV